MKFKLISIFLLILFVYNIFGYIIVFEGMLFQIKKDVKNYAVNKLTEKDLTVIKLNNNIKWLEKNELIYKGELYDVIKRETKNNISYLYCINDKSEEKLFSDLQKDLNKNTDNIPINKQTKTLLKFIPEFALITKLNLSKFMNNFTINHESFRNSYISVSIDIVSPPPENFIFLS